jgi:TrmH family RNA methyltransferase
MTPVITSAANPIVKRVRLLADRKHRRAEAAAVVHGIQPVWQAAEAGYEFETLVVAPDLLQSAAARDFVDARESAGTTVTRLSADLFTRLSDRDRPSGLAAIVRTREWRLDDLPATGTFIAMNRLGNPGNLGTILRTADATGAAGALLVGPTADPWDQAAIKASMGAVFNVPAVRLDDQAALHRWARAHGISVATTAGRAPQAMWRTELPENLVILLGSEGDGLDDESLDRGDLQLSIPMVGRAESLNVAVAAGVLLYEAWRQRAGHQLGSS